MEALASSFGCIIVATFPLSKYCPNWCSAETKQLKLTSWSFTHLLQFPRARKLDADIKSSVHLHKTGAISVIYKWRAFNQFHFAILALAFFPLVKTCSGKLVFGMTLLLFIISMIIAVVQHELITFATERTITLWRFTGSLRWSELRSKFIRPPKSH